MKNIVIAEFKHETNQFNPNPTDKAAYNRRNRFFGEEILERFKGVKNEIGAFLDTFRNLPEFRLIPTVAFNATPAGPVTMDVYEEVESGILGAIRKTVQAGEKVDGVLLSLHGAMVLEADEDGEGRLLKAVRAEVGPEVPIVVSLDLHCNMTKKMAENADAFFVFDYYPHIDMYETGLRAAACMRDCLLGKVRPVVSIRQLDMLLTGMPTSNEPMATFVARMHAMRNEPGILNVNICHGFFHADIHDMGVSVVVVADGDAALARDAANRLGDAIWDARRELRRRLYTIDEAIDRVLQSDEQPIVIADVADNPGGGGTCDTTHILRRLLERKVQNVALAILFDPESAEVASRAGVGSTVSLRLGGKLDPETSGGPIECEAYVKALTDGKYRNRDAMSRGLLNPMGTTAVLVVDGIEIITTSNRLQPWDLEVFRSCGIMPQDKKVLVVKSAIHYKASYGTVAREMLDVEVPGLVPRSPEKLAYRYVRRPIYPLDEI